MEAELLSAVPGVSGRWHPSPHPQTLLLLKKKRERASGLIDWISELHEGKQACLEALVH